jgi:hypothetical protein
MTKRLNWSTRRHDGKPREQAVTPKRERKGAWTHLRKGTCRVYTREECADWLRKYEEANKNTETTSTPPHRSMG